MKQMMRKVLIRTMVCLVVVGLFVLLYSTYSKPVRNIGTTEPFEIEEAIGEDLTDYVSGGYPAFEENGLTLWVDDGGVVWVTDEEDEIIWRNTADDLDTYVEGMEESAYSPVAVQYMFNSEQAVDIYSYDGVQEGNCQIAYNEDETRLQVTYHFGDTGMGGLLPVGLTQQYMEEVVLPSLSASDQDYILRRYELVTPEKAKSKMIELIPGIKTQALYYLANCNSVTMQRKTISILGKAGLTDAIYAQQCTITGEVQPVYTETYLLTVEYWLENGDLMVNIPCDKIRFHPDNPLTQVLLNGYASYAEAEDAGFYLLPMGSGATQSFQSDVERNYTYRFMGETDVEKVNVPLAGTDFPIPTYGVARDDAKGMLVFIEEGGELAFLQEQYKNGASVLKLSFQLIEYGDASIAEQNSSTVFGNVYYHGDIRIRHRFLDAGSTYSDMAEVCRDILLEKKLLPERCATNIRAIVEYIGGVRRNIQRFNLFPVTEHVTLTSYEQTREMTQELEAAGINGLAVKLSGYNAEGLYAQEPGSFKWSDALGSKQEREAMLVYLAEREMPTFLNVNLAFYYQQNNNMFSGYNAQRSSAKTLNNRPAVREVANDSNKQDNPRVGTIHVVAPELYAEVAERTTTAADSRLAISVGESLSYLTVDFASRRYSDRVMSHTALQEALNTLTKERRVMGINPSVNMLRNIELVEHMITYPDLSVNYTSTIPFLQMVMHGHVPYSSQILNGQPDYQMAILEAVETGAIPHYVVAGQFDPAVAQTEYAFLYYIDYGKWKEKIVFDMLRIQQDLGDLAEHEISGHEVHGDVRVVTYDNGVMVYVNYGHENIELNGVKIPAMNYVRVN